MWQAAPVQKLVSRSLRHCRCFQPKMGSERVKTRLSKRLWGQAKDYRTVMKISCLIGLKNGQQYSPSARLA